MMLRHSLLLGAAVTLLAGAADGQTRKPSREDLLGALTRHIQICAELSDPQARLGCYDKLQTQVGDVQAPPPSPTPLNRTPPPPAPTTASPTMPPPPPSTSVTPGQVGSTPLSPPPLMVPGGGAATLGGNGPSTPMASPPTGGPPPMGATPLGPPQGDPDAAFNPRNATTAYPSPEGQMPRPQPPLRRTGPRPVPNYGGSMPLVSMQVTNLTYGPTRYWQVTVSVSSNANRMLDTQVQCSFLNGGRSVGEAYLGPIQLAAGEQATTELIGPPTTVFVDSTNCRVLSP
jgi:hypothetical protein